MDQQNMIPPAVPAPGVGSMPVPAALPGPVWLPSQGCSSGLAALFRDWERAWTIEIAAASAADDARIAVAGGASPPAEFTLLLAAEENAAATLAGIDKAIAAYPAAALSDLLAKLRFLDRLDPFTERAQDGDWDARILASILADAERLNAG